MTYRFAISSTGPLSGKSTLAKYLRDNHGFLLADHGLSVVKSYVEWYNNEFAERNTVEHVYLNKEEYRQELQRHGYEVGFNDPDKSEQWVRFTLSAWLEDTFRDVVFDSIRGDGQAQVLKDMGFTLAQLEISESVRKYRAQELGRDYDALLAAMEAAPELERGIERPDIIIRGESPVDIQARILLDAEFRESLIRGGR